MRILVTGSTGMLGRDLVDHLSVRHRVIPVSRRNADICSSPSISGFIEGAAPDAVIHAAAWTAVDQCEREPEVAFRINAEGTRNVARACQAGSIPVLYLSTDYVFDGEKAEPYIETDQPNPLNVYGKTKLEGERIVASLLSRFWIVRISWLFGPRGRNFVEAVLQQARQGKPLRIVNDQIGAPTYTEDLSRALEEILVKAKPGIYHVTNQGYCSWFQFAREVVGQAGTSGITILPIPSEELARPARRPRNSRLATCHLRASGNKSLPPWQDALSRYLSRRSAIPDAP